MVSEKRFTLNTDDKGVILIPNSILRDGKEMSEREVVDCLNEQQSTIERLEQRDYYNQSERYKILGRAIELASDYIHTNDLEYYDFCGLVTEFEEELLDGKG